MFSKLNLSENFRIKHFLNRGQGVRVTWLKVDNSNNFL